MKKSILLFFFIIGSISFVIAQTEVGWKPNLNEVKFVNSTGEESILGIDQGFRYATLLHQEQEYRLFYNRNAMNINNIRIMDQKSGIQIARGKGSYLFGNSRIEFIDGETVKLKMKRYRNGYTIIGPFGELFKVENQAFSPVKTFGEKDFVSQAFFLFEWIKTTQNPPQDVVLMYTAQNSN